MSSSNLGTEDVWSAAVTVSWALDATPDTGFKFVAVHPGTIKIEQANFHVERVLPLCR